MNRGREIQDDDLQHRELDVTGEVLTSVLPGCMVCDEPTDRVDAVYRICRRCGARFRLEWHSTTTWKLVRA